MEYISGICPNCFAQDYPGMGKCPRCGYLPISQGASSIMLRPGSLLNKRYLIGRALGMGGFGITYLACDSGSGRLCAIKEYLPTQIAARDTRNSYVIPGSAGDRDTYLRGIELFAKEAQMLSGFAGSHSIVQVWDFFEDNNTAYFVMEYLDGVTLKALIRSMNGRIPVTFANDIFINIGNSLGEVHKKGMLHRDVSPENIIITRKGEFKLIDFGATRFFVGEKSKSLSVVLKPGFAPPEQYSSRGNQGPWVDVYALAATFYLSVSGVLLPDATDRLAGVGYAPLYELESSVDKKTSDCVDKALMLNYKQRYQTISAFIEAMFLKNASQPSRQQGAKMPSQVGASASSGAFSQVNASASQAVKQPDFDMQHLRSSPCLLELRGGAVRNKWILPKNMDMVIGTPPVKSNINVKIPDGREVHCTLRYDDKQGCFYLMNNLAHHAFLINGTPLIHNQVYTLKAKDGFCLGSEENKYQVEVE